MIIRGISLTYKNDSSEKEALKNVNITLPNKGLVFITGKSGSGKTTLLHIIGKILAPSSGEIIDHDYQVKDIGFIFQENNLLKSLNIEENIILGSKEKSIKKVDEIAKKLKINHLIFENMKNLSGGEKQRVAIARCLYRDNKIILADEPTTSLDQENQENIINILKEISKEKLVIIVSHNETLVSKYADRQLILVEGKVVEDKTFNDTDFRDKKPHMNDNQMKNISTIIYTRNLKNIFNLTNIFIFILSFILLTSFITFFSLTTIKKNDIGLTNSYDNSEDFVYATSSEKSVSGLKKIEVDKIVESNPNNDFYYLIKSKLSIPYYQKHDNLNYLEGLLNSNRKLNMLEIEENDLINLEFKIIEGRFPQNYDEVLITDLQYYLLKRFGVYNEEISYENTRKNINNFNDLGEINLGHNVKITGVIDTNINIEEFNNILNVNNLKTAYEIDSSNDFSYTLEKTVHNALIGLTGFVNYHKRETIEIKSQQFIINNYTFNSSFLKKDASKILKDDEIGIDYVTAEKYKLIKEVDFNIIEFEQLKNVINIFAKNNFEEIKENFIEYQISLGYPGSLEYTHLDYGRYIINTSDGENIFHPGIDKKYFSDKLDNSIEIETDINFSIYIYDTKYTFKLKRIYKKHDYEGIIMPANLYNILEYEKALDYSSIFTKLSNNRKEDIKLLRYQFADNDIKFSNRTINQINIKDEAMNAYSEKIIMIIPFLVIFIFILLLSIIFINIKNSKREIAILGTLGYSKTRTATFYLSNYFVIIFIAYLFSILTSFFVVDRINYYSLGPVSIIDYFLKVSFLNIFYPLLIVVVMIVFINYIVFNKIDKLNISLLLRGE